MLDISKTIEARSDQLNACDLLGGPVTLKITDVKVVAGDQPVHIYYEGCGERVYKPCLSMRRVLVMAWKKDASLYIGRSMVAYNDPSIRWANSEVGGIRISHLSHIDKPIRVMLTVTRGKKAPFTVQPLQLTAGPPLSQSDADLWKAQMDRATSMKELSETAAQIKGNNYADSAEKTAVLAHYQSAVAAIRAKSEQPADPANLDYPPDEGAEGAEVVPGN